MEQASHSILGVSLQQEDEATSLDAQLLRQYDELVAIKAGSLIETRTLDELMAKRAIFIPSIPLHSQ